MTGGAIGTAEWGGARLRDVLLYAGVNEEDIEHVHLEGLDNSPLTGERYGGSVRLQGHERSRRLSAGLRDEWSRDTS